VGVGCVRGLMSGPERGIAALGGGLSLSRVTDPEAHRARLVMGASDRHITRPVAYISIYGGGEMWCGSPQENRIAMARQLSAR
jgi:hypothetical protein